MLNFKRYKAQAQSERRTTRRTSLMREVDALIEDRRVPLLVYDLSMDGCKIDTSDEELSGGDDISLQLHDDVLAKGKVVWRINRNAGVQFDEMLSRDALKAVLSCKTGVVER